MSYVDAVRKRELKDGQDVDTLAPPPSSLHQLYLIGTATDAFRGNLAVSNSYMEALETVRASRLQRLELVKSHIPGRNFAILFLMGFLTQAAIAFSHSSNRSAMAYSVMLFSIAFSAAIYFIMTFDNPYSAGYDTSLLELAGVL